MADHKKVALVGSASSSLGQTPWDDESFEIWGLAWRADLTRVTRVFDMHTMDEARLSGGKVPPNYFNHLNAFTCPVYLLERLDTVPNSMRYPIEDVIEFLSKYDKYADGDYFVSSIAYMLALAMYEGFEEIHLYGIDLIDKDEYAHQRPNAEYLIGLARGMGISVFIPEQSALLKHTHRYGYEPNVQEGIITIELLEHRKKQYKQRMERALAEAHTCDGAMQECDGLMVVLRHHQRGHKINEPSSAV